MAFFRPRVQRRYKKKNNRIGGVGLVQFENKKLMATVTDRQDQNEFEVNEAQIASTRFCIP